MRINLFMGYILCAAAGLWAGSIGWQALAAVAVGVTGAILMGAT